MLVFIAFAGFIGTLVYLMTRERIDLVRDDYYQDEIAYQQHIDRLNRTSTNNALFAMTYQSDQQQVSFVLPDSLQKAVITFYRPADRLADFAVVVTSPHPTRKTVSTVKMVKGYWRVQLAWSDARRDYYKENELFID